MKHNICLINVQKCDIKFKKSYFYYVFQAISLSVNLYNIYYNCNNCTIYILFVQSISINVHSLICTIKYI